MGKEIDPADIGKHADLIKKAQADIVYSDVLVCGRCHTVFHLVELFQEHKENEPECRRATNALHQCDEAQAKVWAFLLWKSAQRNAISNESDKSGGNNSWKLYQSWVKLDESVRDTWIVAGKTIQSFTRIGSGTLQEMPVKITKTILETDSGRANAANRTTLQGRKPADTKPVAGGLGSPDAKRATPAGGLVGAAGRKPEPNNAALKLGVTKRAFAKRTAPKTGETVEEEVEKILAKRFSPVIKMHEYLVKWSKMGNDQNTWEPLTHLHSCQSILEYFEVQLAKQKEQRAATAARTLQQQQQNKAKPTTAAGATNVTRSPLSPQRPGRFSKTSALDRVKMWTSGNRSPGDSGDGGGDDAVGIKRKLEDTDTDNTGADSAPDGSAKKSKTEPHIAISEALSKVSQTGNVKIMPVSAAGSKLSPSGATVNGAGTGDVSQKTADAAEVLIIKSPRDSTVSSGITRKPGAQPSGTSPRGEAKVKIVNRSEPVAHGIFKVGTDAGAGTTQTSPHVVSTSVTSPVVVTRSGPISTNTPNSVTSGDVTTRFVRRNVDGTQQLVKQTIRKATKFVSSTPTAQRPGAVGTRVGTAVATPQKTVTPATSVAGVQQRTSTSPRVATTGTPAARVGVKGTPVGAGIMRTAVSTTPLSAVPSGSSEQKINALRKQGLNVVKRSVVTGSPATKKVMATKAEEEDEGQGDGFPPNLSLPAPPSPPRALTLCPVTGKVLGQAEGEPTPVPSPEETESGTTDDKSGNSHQKTESGVLAEQQHQMTDPQTEVHQLLTNEDGSPIIVAGEDGTLYQVAGKNAEGQTILIAQGADGEQSCVLMAAQEGEDDITNGATAGVLTLDAAVSEAVAQVGVSQEGQQLSEDQVVQFQHVSGAPNQQLTIQTEDSQDGQITAEIVQAGQPSPGGTRQVVLMLPNGSFMMTEVTEEQYQSLNLNNPTEE
ncbi:mucin-19 [Anopheles bellator]|uniref:mucin-19 n=1 Tax=Anopheles bellator TaxID=139047 RepID=UPI002648419E|nr:mucin-19 [Anopheles bellator]